MLGHVCMLLRYSSKTWYLDQHLNFYILNILIFCHQQGLRTLELCVDNLQPDFLYDHIQPVRAELFQVSEQYNFEMNDN